MLGRHGECEAKHTAALRSLLHTATQRALGNASVDELRLKLSLASEKFVSDEDARDALVEGYEDAACKMVAGDWISAENEGHLAAYVAEMNLSEAECNRSGAQERVRMSAQLRRIATETATSYEWQSRLGSFPFGFNRSGERVVWAIRSVQVEFGSTRERETDDGQLVMTNRGLYFAGQEGSHQVTLGRIHNLRREYDGFAIHTGASAKTYTFNRHVDGWFAWKLLKLLVKMN